jgi:hypothetical protein
MRSNSNDVVVVDAMDCGSGGGGSAQLRPDRGSGGVIRAAGGSGSGRIGRRRGSGAGVVGRCWRGILARRDDDRGIDDGGRGAVWEASAGGDQTESFDLLTA